MSDYESLENELAINLIKRKDLVRSILDAERSYNHDAIVEDDLLDKITDWKFDLFILNKEANRIMRKMMNCEDVPAEPFTDLSTD